MKNAESPQVSRRRQLINHAALTTRIAAISRSSIKISSVVKDHTSQRKTAIRASRKCIEDGFRPSVLGWAEFKNCAGITSSAELGGSVEIACTIKDHARIWLVSVRTAGETVEDLLRSCGGAGE